MEIMEWHSMAPVLFRGIFIINQPLWHLHLSRSKFSKKKLSEVMELTHCKLSDHFRRKDRTNLSISKARQSCEKRDAIIRLLTGKKVVSRRNAPQLI